MSASLDWPRRRSRRQSRVRPCRWISSLADHAEPKSPANAACSHLREICSSNLETFTGLSSIAGASEAAMFYHRRYPPRTATEYSEMECDTVPGQNIGPRLKPPEASQGEELLPHLSLHLPLECLRQLELLQAPGLRQDRHCHLGAIFLLVFYSHHQLAITSIVGCFPPFSRACQRLTR